MIMEQTFVGANNELRKCIKLLDEERIQNFCAPKEIERKFQPCTLEERGRD